MTMTVDRCCLENAPCDWRFCPVATTVESFIPRVFARETSTTVLEQTARTAVVCGFRETVDIETSGAKSGRDRG